ncbi:hypothetical protein [Streptomyces sp. ISL-100]|uniref:hypothetical protein n=1 Tax=Streptomyces sp. ISL-100 TaxID=2819173 RepID=UPI001BE7199B|nr:hypothetical protein [Streptomyces sp. ISL-100]MBT2398824.1 hypothetical protein [Streptomyces sp. ISL-100]
MEAVDDVAAGDHVGGGEVFEGLALSGVVGVDTAVDPDAQEHPGLGGLDGTAYGRTEVLPPGDGVGLVGRGLRGERPGGGLKEAGALKVGGQDGEAARTWTAPAPLSCHLAVSSSTAASGAVPVGCHSPRTSLDQVFRVCR